MIADLLSRGQRWDDLTADEKVLMRAWWCEVRVHEIAAARRGQRVG